MFTTKRTKDTKGLLLIITIPEFNSGHFEPALSGVVEQDSSL